MSFPEIESPEDFAAVESLHDLCFGTDRHFRPSYQYREYVSPLTDLCAVIREDDQIIAGVRFWPVEIAGHSETMLLLGPLAVHPDHAHQGYGRSLVTHALGAAAAQGYRHVVLVGHPEYFRKFGFVRLDGDPIFMPGAEPTRLLTRWIGEGPTQWPSGMIVPSGTFAAAAVAE